MAKREYVFLTGTAKWAKLDVADKDYGYYGLELYPDKDGMKEYKSSGLQLEIKNRDDGEGDYIRLRRVPDKLFEGMDEKPKKLIRNEQGEYVPFDKLISNGSAVTCKVEVFQTKRGKGHRLEAVAVEKLVPYEGGASDNSDLPF